MPAATAAAAAAMSLVTCTRNREQHERVGNRWAARSRRKAEGGGQQRRRAAKNEGIGTSKRSGFTKVYKVYKSCGGRTCWFRDVQAAGILALAAAAHIVIPSAPEPPAPMLMPMEALLAPPRPPAPGVPAHMRTARWCTPQHTSPQQPLLLPLLLKGVHHRQHLLRPLRPCTAQPWGTLAWATPGV